MYCSSGTYIDLEPSKLTGIRLGSWLSVLSCDSLCSESLNTEISMKAYVSSHLNDLSSWGKFPVTQKAAEAFLRQIYCDFLPLTSIEIAHFQVFAFWDFFYHTVLYAKHQETGYYITAVTGCHWGDQNSSWKKTCDNAHTNAWDSLNTFD